MAQGPSPLEEVRRFVLMGSLDGIHKNHPQESFQTSETENQPDRYHSPNPTTKFFTKPTHQSSPHSPLTASSPPPQTHAPQTSSTSHVPSTYHSATNHYSQCAAPSHCVDRRSGLFYPRFPRQQGCGGRRNRGAGRGILSCGRWGRSGGEEMEGCGRSRGGLCLCLCSWGTRNPARAG